MKRRSFNTVAGRKRHNQIDGQFAARIVDLLESPAYRVLTLTAHRVLSRIEVEFAHHGGRDNGDLPVTYDNFEAYGSDRHGISPALRELHALGIIGIKPGRAGNAEWRLPNRFRLTYRPTNNEPPTHDWKKFETMEEALKIARWARSVRNKPGCQEEEGI